MSHQSARRLLIAGMLASLLGCSATGPAFKESSGAISDKATVYVYRPSSFVNSGAAPNLYVNDADHGPLWNAGYIPLALPPGKVVLVLKGEKMKWGLQPIGTSAQIEAGKTYYFRMGNRIESADYSGNPGKEASSANNMSPVMDRVIQIQQVPSDLGHREIAETKLAGQARN
jgi:hypothetical protein